MKAARLVVGACAAVALVAAAFDADAKGGRGGGGGRGGKGGGGHHSHSHGGHSHHHTGKTAGSGHRHGHYHSHTTFFVGGSFVMWPAAYYWPGYYPGSAPVAEYWYYCQPYAAYYPYVQDCPVEWQLVLPTIPSPEG